jgi:hypothetical protein
MLTGAQFGRYNREWPAVCAAKGWDENDKAVQIDFHRALGLPDSRAHWNTRRDFDTFLGACKEAKGQRTGGQKRVDEDGERRRLVWRIKDDAKKAGLGPDYIIECARDLHVLGNWTDLDIDSLTNLMKTIHNRAGQKLGHDPRNVPHAGRRYLLVKIPRMFTPRPAKNPARGLPADITLTEFAYSVDPDNEPF